MFGSQILEVAIGVILVFLLVSIICTAVREGIEGFLKTRAAFLEHGIRELLHDTGAVGVARSFYTHPLIYGLYAHRYEPPTSGGRPSSVARGRNLPTYIPSRNFALALMDIAARGPAGQVSVSDAASPVLSLASVRANLVNIENASVQRVLLTAIDTAQGDLDKAVANIAAWYDSAMDRVSGAYKRSTQKMLLVIGLVVAVVLNVDALTIANFLYRNDAARSAIVARAEAVARDSSFMHGDSTHRYASARAALDSLRLPIGWVGATIFSPSVDTTFTTDSVGVTRRVIAQRGWLDHVGQSKWDYLLAPLLGWFITALAATLGAPFWFDLLNKMMVIRSTVKPHEKSPEESSEDRQSSADSAKVARGDVGANANAVGAAAVPAAAPPGIPGPAPDRPVPVAAPARDPEENVDGCDVEIDPAHPETITSDEALPPALGGVA
ncbi:MAG: hypothetical protein JWL95_1539 [Gemmatimonadetes bacterium]|nr:hypothetical protein [Gemmatimonadota bacterium]